MAQDLPSADALEVIPPSVLARVPGCEAGQRPHAIAALSGGTVNTSFRVDTRAGSFVLRLNGVAGALLGADHAREARLHAAAAVSGVAPELIYADLEQRFMIMRCVDGAAWDASDFGRPERLRELGATLRTLHAISPPTVAPFNLAAILQGHSAKIIDAQPAERGLLESLMEEAGTALALCARGGRATAIVHNDLYHSNLIDGEHLYLIDWEYAAVADPIFDPACVLAYHPHAEPYAQELLDAAGLAEVPLAVLFRARFLFMLLSFLWYRLRRLTAEVTATAELAAEGALLRRLRG